MSRADSGRGLSAVLLVVAVVFTGVTLAGTVAAQSAGEPGVVYVTDAGLHVTDNADAATPSGNPFPNATALALPNLTVSAPGIANATVTVRNGTTVGLADVNASRNPLSLSPDSSRRVTVMGRLATLQFAGVSPRGGTPDLRGEAVSNWSVSIADVGRPAGTRLVAVDRSSGATLERANVTDDGTVTFEELPPGSFSIDVREPESDDDEGEDDRPGTPTFELTSSLEPRTVTVGEAGTVSVTIRNIGDASGVRAVSIAIGGETVDRSVLLDPGGQQTFTLAREFEVPGTYDVTVDGTVIGTFDVVRIDTSTATATRTDQAGTGEPASPTGTQSGPSRTDDGGALGPATDRPVDGTDALALPILAVVFALLLVVALLVRRRD